MNPSTTKPTPSGATTPRASTSTIARAPSPAAAKRAGPLAAQIHELLARYTDVLLPLSASVAGSLTLMPAECHQLEETLGLGATRSPESFVAAVARLASMKIGDIRIPFTPGQLAELQHRAQKRGRSLEAEMKAVVARIEDEIFYKGGG